MPRGDLSDQTVKVNSPAQRARDRRALIEIRPTSGTLSQQTAIMPVRIVAGDHPVSHGGRASRMIQRAIRESQRGAVRPSEPRSRFRRRRNERAAAMRSAESPHGAPDARRLISLDGDVRQEQEPLPEFPIAPCHQFRASAASHNHAPSLFFFLSFFF